MRGGPAKPKLVKKILKKIEKYPEGIWIRKLARELNEPVATIHKYVNRKEYVGKFVKVERRSQELGGNLIIKLRGKAKK